MEVTSTGGFISKVEDVNTKNIMMEDIDLEQIDEHLNEREREAQRRYDEFDDKMWKSDKNLHTGWETTYQT